MAASSYSQTVNKLLRALDNVKKDFTCGVCSQLCTEPVTLSVCFHMVCQEHFEGLKTCPTCNASLKNCKIFKDKELEATIPATRALDEMFSALRTEKENTLSNANNNSSKKHEAAKKRRSTKKEDINEMLINVNTQSTDKKSENKTKTSKNQSHKGSKHGSVENLNTTGLSNATLSRTVKTLEKRNNKGETALHIACRLNKVDKVAELLNQGAMPNTKDNAGWTPLHEFVQNGQIEIVKLLIQHNALINVPGQGNETPLHEALRYGHKDIIKVLVQNGADINARNIKGETPLDLAKDNLRVVLEKAAEEIIQTQTVNINHISNLHSELDFEDIKVYCITETKAVHTKLKTLASHHSNLHIEPKLTKKVTHIIVDADESNVCVSSFDILQGIVDSNWILSSKWVLDSTQESLASFEDYEIIGVGTKNCNGPRNSRYNKYKQLPGIFNGCHFYLHHFPSKCVISDSLTLTKAGLMKLIMDADGVILKRAPNPESIPESERLVPYHASKGGKLVDCSHYIIFKDMYEPLFNMSHLKALPIGWLIECLEKYELCEPWSMVLD